MSASRPFVVDPDVLARIRPMQARDAEAVAKLHHAAMGNSLWARIGLRFLTVLYRSLVDSEGFIAFVYAEPDAEGTHRVRGFIAGSTDTDTMLHRTFRRAWFLLGPAALPGALRPDVLGQLRETGRYAQASGEGLPPGCTAESLFCSFAPDLRGKRISGHINKVLFDDLASRGHEWVKITTEANNEAALRQLHSWGFEDHHQFRFYGKDMVALVLNLAASPRVEPIGRHPMLERLGASSRP